MDPDGTLIAQPKKYISKILDSFHQMFTGESLPQVKSPLDKNDYPELDNSELASDDLTRKLYCANTWACRPSMVAMVDMRMQACI